ncbi:MAG: Gfo/Idh/MocA family oxidoreductase [Planctomycetes bacterium]|nr:Gfo/Idh/MocA family oxidoreductase [Planctomycetota bacterium]
MESKDLTRRGFLARAAGTTAGIALAANPARVLGANERMGVGVIGCGGRGSYHAHVLKNLHDGGYPVDIVAVCDTFRGRLDRAAKAHGAKPYMNHEDLLADAGVDAVFIATPDHIHGYQVIDAARAGKDMYCEKPLTHWRQFELAKRLRREVKERERVFQIGSQGMSDGAWHQSAALIRAGEIGRPIHAECGYFRVGDWGERGMPIDDPNVKPGDDLRWEAFLGDAPKRPFDVSRYFRWRMYEDYSGGPVTDLFPHSLAPVVHMLGVTIPSCVVATGGIFRYPEREVPDTCNLLADYPEKLTIAVLGTQGNDDPGTGNRGAGGRIPTIRGWDASLTIQGNEIVLRPAGGSKKEPKRIPIERGEDIGAYFRDFLDRCRDRKPTLGHVDLAVDVQIALQMAMLAWREKTMARFDPEKEEIIL